MVVVMVIVMLIVIMVVVVCDGFEGKLSRSD